MSAETDDGGQRPPPDERVRATLSRRPRGPRHDDDGREQVVLREVEPGGDDARWPRPPAAASVAASLIEAFQSPAYVDPSTVERGDRADRTTEDHATDTDIGERATDITTGADERATVAIDDTPDASGLRTGPTDDAHETRPGRGTDDATAADAPAEATAASPAHEMADATDRVRTDETGPITDRFANIPTVPMEPPSVPAGTADAAPAPIEAVGDTAVPPAPVRAGLDPAAVGPVAADATTTGPPSPRRPTGADATARPDAARPPDATTPAWRAALSDAVTWTTVAQFTLLFIGMLCVFQVVVLLVVNQYLSQTGSQGAAVANVLAAHAKVATVMLPALVGGAFAAAAFAAWRAHADPPESDDTSRLRRQVLGLPVAVWGVFGAATALLIVVLFGTSSSVAEAQRMTWWAIGACTLLGIACIAAPRGLATRDPDDEEHSASGSAGG